MVTSNDPTLVVLVHLYTCGIVYTYIYKFHNFTLILQRSGLEFKPEISYLANDFF